MRIAAMEAPLGTSVAAANGFTCLVARVGLVALAGCVLPVGAQAAGEPAGRQVWLGDELAVTYLARVERDWLVVEARHEPGWHTYAMDNLERAAAATRQSATESAPETELPTRITPSAEIELRGPWRQTDPVDLSDPEILWYTWGFEARSYFAAPVEHAAPGAWVSIHAQACTDRLCAMVEDLRVPVAVTSKRSIDPATLVAVAGDEDDSEEGRASSTGVREQLAEFGDWFQRALDVECSGQVPAARLVEIMAPGVDRPRQMNWVMALDGDEDGFVEPDEVGLGLWKNLEFQVERRMVGDVDGDALLSPREYALFVPDPGAETNEEQVSELQDRYFSDLDANEDRLVSRDEIIRNFGGGYIARHWAHMVVFHLGRADDDGNGVVDHDELARAIGRAGGSASRAALDDWFAAVALVAGPAGGSAPEAELSLSESLTLALAEAGAAAEEREKLEAPIRPLLSPACSAR